MGTRLKIAAGEHIPMRNGGVSPLILLCDLDKRHGLRYVSVLCACGNTFTCYLNAIRTGSTSRCKQCQRAYIGQRTRRDLSGSSFGRLTVLEIDGKTTGKALTYTCKCSCGTVIYNIPGGRLTSGNTTSCGCLHRECLVASNEKRGTDWQPGKTIDKYTILERVACTGKKQHVYRVLNTETGHVNTMSASALNNMTGSVSRIARMLRALTRSAIRRKGMQKTKSATLNLPWTPEEIIAHIGVRPSDGEWHIDHICPLSAAETEDEVLLLNNPINLRWLSASENMKKSARWTEEGARLHLLLLGREWKHA